MTEREIIAPHAPLRREPRPDAPLDTEALKGERVMIDITDDEGWGRGTLLADGYTGWLPLEALAPPGPPVTHRVVTLRTLAYPGPSIKVPPVEALSFGSRVSVVRENGPFAVTASGLHLPARHLVPLAAWEADPVAVAERFVGTPYLWGGKTSFGLDCSALVQLSLNACGIACPRDSGPQENSVGLPLALEDAQRGDLIFWPGHVAMLRDRDTIIHANAFHMAVAIENASEAIARIVAGGDAVRSVRRPIPAR